MYTRQEESRQKQVFWTTFGQYMQPVSPADNMKVNWVNYKTGVPGISFKMDAGNADASIAIVLSNGDADVLSFHYEQLSRLKMLLHDALGEEWSWQPPEITEHGKWTGKVGTSITNVNINRNEDWPVLISFFKTRIVALDAFWSTAKYAFDV